jgi:Peptidase propeptide and YPEB domain
MKTKRLLGGLLAAGLLASGPSGCATEKQEQAELQAQAKISREAAQQTALAKVPGGTVKDGELEKEKGKLIWSFDITTPSSKDIAEVAVDAITGAVVAVDIETPEQQAKEAAEDAAKSKKKGEDKD